MSDWRVVTLDDETMHRVMPVCPYAATNHYIEDEDGAPLPGTDPLGVYDCCPGPQIECFTASAAQHIAQVLTDAEAEPCPSEEQS